MEAATESLGHDIVVVGASAGGVEALREVVARLPADLEASVFVVLHLPPVGTSVLPKILSRAGKLDAVHASDGERFALSRIYIAPPDQHMSLADGHIRLDRGPKVNGHRPSIDSLFESAATTFGGRVTGVILSGVLDDGAAGIRAVVVGGGATLVQSAGDALYPTMPAAALEAIGEPDFIGTATEIADHIVALTSRPPMHPPPQPRALHVADTDEYIEIDRASSEHPRPGEASAFTCPECHGVLWQDASGNGVRFRCRTGHEFSPESLLLEQDEHVERALWAALRALEEKAAMLRRMSLRFRDRDHPATSVRLEQKANHAVQEALAIRELLRRFEPVGEALDEQRAV